MSVYLDTNLETICRCCLAPGVLKSLFTRIKSNIRIQYHEMMKFCCELPVTENDGLPTQICTNCLTKLKSSYKFKQKCIESNTELLNLKAKTIKHEKDDIHLEKIDNICNELHSEEVKHLSQRQENDENGNEYVDQMKSTKTEFNVDCQDYEKVKEEFNIESQADKSLEEHIEKSNPNEETKKKYKSEGPKCKKKSKKSECETCGKQFYKLSTLQEHINWIHYGIKRYHCSICNKDYMNEKQHRNLHEKPFSATCDQCGKIYTSERKYKYHILENHGNKEHICECGAIFKSESALKKHMIGVHAPKKYMCHICSKAFTMRSYLIIHLRLHTGEKPYACQLCDMRFRVKYMFKRHMMGKHSDVRSLRCPQCPKEFKTRNVLSKHMAVHAEVRQFACRVCQKPFGRVDNRNVHERSVHSVSKEEAKLMWPS